jgi:hypothetical protein
MKTTINIVKIKLGQIYKNLLSTWFVWLGMLLFMVVSEIIFKSVCVFSAFTGVPCPGCGTTRAFSALLKGDFELSFHFHPMLIPVILVMAFLSYTYLTHLKTPKYARYFVWVFFVLYIATYIIRMILFFPNDEPMTIRENAVLPRIFHGLE